MLGHAADRFAEFEVIAKALGRFLVGFAARAGELAGAMENLSQFLPHIGPFAQPFGQNVAHAQQRVGRAGDAPVEMNELGGPGVEVRARRRCLEDFVGQRLQTPFAGHGGQRLLLGLERQIEIFEPLRALGGFDLGG